MADPKSNNLNLNLPDKGSNKNEWDVPVNENFQILDDQFSGAGEVGHSHSGVNGQGPKIDHANLNDAGTNTHAEIDTHIADASIHGPFTDETLGKVTNADNSDEFTNVTEIQFANTSIQELSSGVVLVTAQAQTAAEELLNNSTTSAAVAWTDNFNWPVGTLLGDQCWATDVTTDGPSFAVRNNAGSGAGTRAELIVPEATTGAVTSLADCHVPHGLVQRVTVVVDDVSDGATDLVATGDAVTLSLDLLSTPQVGGVNRPTLRGVSLLISKAAGSNLLTYQLSVDTSTGPSPQVTVDLTTAIDTLFTPVTGYSGDLTQEFLEGCHEFSVSRAKVESELDNDTPAITFHYYYNYRLAATFTCSPASTATAQQRSFYSKVDELINQVFATSNPVEPEFGRIGFGVGYDVRTGSALQMRVRCVTVTSQDDIFLPTPGELPTTDIDPGGGGEPCCPPGTTGGGVDVGDPFVNGGILDVGDPFDYDGPNIFGTTWVIDSEVIAQNGNDVGFLVVETNVAEPRSFTVFCEPPAPAASQSGIPYVPTATVIGAGAAALSELILEGSNLPEGQWDANNNVADSQQLVQVSIFTDQDLYYSGGQGWMQNSANAQLIPAGTQLYPTYNGPGALGFLSGMIVFSDQEITIDDTGSQRKLISAAATTALSVLPKGATFTIRLTPKFNTNTADWSAEFPGALRIAQGNPFDYPVTLTKFKYDPYATNPSWEPITNGLTEGDVVLFGFSGIDMPVGQGYWSQAGDGPVWSISDANSVLPTDGLPPNVSAPYVFANPNAQVQASFAVINMPDTAMANTVPSGAPLPDGSIGTTQFNPAIGPNSIGFENNGFWGTWKINNDFFTAALTGGTDLRIRVFDQTSNVEFGAFDIALVSEISARPLSSNGAILIDPSDGTDPITQAGNIVTVLASLSHSDWESGQTGLFEADLVSGFANNGTTLTDSDFSANGSGATKVFALELQELSATEGENIVVTYRNKLAFDQGQAGQELTINFGQVAAGTTPAEPAIINTASAGVIENDSSADNQITLNVEAIVDGASVEFYAPGLVVTSGAITTATTRLDPTYISVAGATPAIPAGGAGDWVIPLNVIDPDDTLATVTPTGAFDIVIRNPDGQYSNVSSAGQITFDQDPTFNSIQVLPAADHLPGELDLSNAAAPGAVFNIEIDLIGAASNFDGGPPTITTSGGYFSSFVVLPNPVGNVWTISAQLNGTAALGDTADLVITKQPAPGGTGPSTVALSALEFVQSLGVGGGGSNPGTLGATFGGGPFTSSVNPTSFSGAPAEGLYSEFTIAGRFAPEDGTGSNLTVDFVDSTGTTVAASTTITAATTSSISGFVRWADNKAGKLVTTKITDSTLSQTVTAGTSARIVQPAAPRVRSAVLTPAYEGTTGATLTIYGTGLVPGSVPSGASALNYSYSLFDSGDDTAFSSATLTSSSSTQLVYSVDIAASTAGRSFGVAINYLGGNTLRAGNLGFILSQPAGDPTITGLTLYNEFADPDAATVVAPVPNTDKTALLRIQGTNLGSANVDPGGLGDPASDPGVYLEIVGEEDDSVSSDIKETPPGPGLSAALSEDRIEVVEIVTQSTDEIIARVPASIPYSNLRARVWLNRPATHPDGAGEWDLAAVDATGAGNARGLTSIGTTVRYGQHARGPKVNVDPTQGATQLDVARSLQSQVGPGTEGGFVTLTVRLREAVATTEAPAVTAVASDLYGVKFENIAVTKLVSPFEIQITMNVPEPGVNNTYPDASFTTATPVVCALQFANGSIIAGATLGANDWGDTGSFIAYS